jgi:uncharacterized tellurite resistance protein B-like protein
MSGSILTTKATRAFRSFATDVTGVVRAWGVHRGGPVGARSASDPSDPRVASAALLLEVAHADDRFSEQERQIVEDTLRREFGLDPARAGRLVEAAARVRGDASGPWVFTNVLVEAFSTGQRRNLVRIMDRLARVDDGPTWRESYVLGQIASLLRVEASSV